MQKIVFAAGLVLLLVMVAVPFIFAKTPLDKVTIDGPRLRRSRAVAITDPKMLEDFNPWIAPFLGRPLDEEPAHAGRRYDVSMYLQDEADGSA